MSSSNIADEENKILTYHRIIEAFKFAYGKRTEMGDEDFVDIKQVLLFHDHKKVFAIP